MNKELKNLIENDIYRHFENNRPFMYKWRTPNLNYMIIFRKANYHYTHNHKIRAFFYKFKMRKLSNKYHIQIPIGSHIGKGFYIGHFGRVIINGSAVIGNNCNIGTGVTIGYSARGKYKGVPTIGNKVWIGTNAVIVGNINIGDDVLIAPNAYVNRDVPAHSIVFGNPMQIKPRDNATEDYIIRVKEDD